MNSLNETCLHIELYHLSRNGNTFTWYNYVFFLCNQFFIFYSTGFFRMIRNGKQIKTICYNNPYEMYPVVVLIDECIEKIWQGALR